ncbi:MAG: hypothetical protein PHI45_02035 [Candidatus Pacebacteria bacterium]|nr:hypothetical protein [Candidatus Paceibacterota bacterium]MDD5752839.1 hypothetical protein [Candidatus Paceibacterota bacterium]
MDYFERIKNSIENAKNIVIVANNNADKDIMAATLAMFFALKNKYNVFLPEEKNPEKLIEFLNEDVGKKKIVISLKNDISEISYQKSDNGIDLHLIPKNIEDLSPENFSCKLISEEKPESFSSLPIFDLIIAFNIKSFNELENYFQENTDSVYNCTVMNIDNNDQNENYGEINIIEKDSSVSEQIAILIKNIYGKINDKAAGFLLWGIISNLNNKKTFQTLKIIKWLIGQGGNLYFNHTKPETKRKLSLLGKTIENLKFIETDNFYLSSLSEKDLKTNDSTSADISFVIEKIKNYFSIPSFMLLWEGRSSPVSIKGVFYSKKEDLINKIKNTYSGSYKGEGGIFLTKNQDLFSAEKEITSLLWKK